jgi:hypothetical protein
MLSFSVALALLKDVKIIEGSPLVHVASSAANLLDAEYKPV